MSIIGCGWVHIASTLDVIFPIIDILYLVHNWYDPSSSDVVYTLLSVIIIIWGLSCIHLVISLNYFDIDPLWFSLWLWIQITIHRFTMYCLQTWLHLYLLQGSTMCLIWWPCLFFHLSMGMCTSRKKFITNLCLCFANALPTLDL